MREMKEKLAKLLFETIKITVCVYILFLFTDKGQTIREIGIYLPTIFIFLRCLLLKDFTFFKDLLKNKFFIVILALCVSGLISSFISPDPLYSLKWFKRTYLPLFLVSISIAYTFQDVSFFKKMKILFVFVLIFFIILTIKDFYHMQTIKSDDFAKFTRKYINPLEIFIFSPILLLLLNEKKYIKLICILIFILSFIAMILTGSRGGWLAIFCGFLFLLFFVGFLNKKIFKILIFLLVSAILFLLLIFSSNIEKPSYLKMKFKQLFEGDTSLRLEYVWPGAIGTYLELPLENKLLGRSLGRITYAEDFSSWYIKKHKNSPPYIYSPHNFYIYLLYKQGIVGFFIFSFLIYMIFKELLSTLLDVNKNLEFRSFALFILASFINLLVHGFFEDTRFIQWIFILSLITGFNHLIKKQLSES